MVRAIDFAPDRFQTVERLGVGVTVHIVCRDGNQRDLRPDTLQQLRAGGILGAVVSHDQYVDGGKPLCKQPALAEIASISCNEYVPAVRLEQDGQGGTSL